MAGIAEALQSVRGRLEAALREAGRPPGAVRLIAIGKTKPASMLREAYAAGQRDFGESYAQELRDKARELADFPDLRWHFVGRLQLNKAKYVAAASALVHSIDDVRLAAELARRAAGSKVRCLVEINVGGEAQKSGVVPADAEALCRGLLALERVELVGLMCIPPDDRPPRPHFAALRRLRDDLEQRLGARLPELSMGMSADCEDAVREGSTLVRVGTAIFGPRI